LGNVGLWTQEIMDPGKDPIMTDESYFVEASIRHQVGNYENSSFKINEKTIEKAKSVLSGMALMWDHTTQALDPFNGWLHSDGELQKEGHKVNLDKVAGALSGIRSHAPKYSFFVDMADHRARSLTTSENEAAPVFCFNRPNSKPDGKVLWPLSGYQDLSTNDFLGSCDIRDVPWSEKVAQVCWRGSAGGWAQLGKYGRGKMIRMHALLNKNRRGKISDEDTKRALLTVDRHRFIETCYSDPHFDVGYTQFGPHDYDSFPLIGGLKKERLSMVEQTKFKYLAVLPGADIGSNFYWVLNSSSLGFVMETDYDSFASAHFKPWEHYVPIRADLRDLEKNFAWCENNPEDCKAMVKNANKVCALLGDERLRNRVLQGVVEEVGRRLS
jgi:hypothetical protein